MIFALSKADSRLIGSKMLPRTNRLVRKNDFDKVYRSRSRAGGKGFVVFFKLNNKDNSRFGFVVSKKFGKANRRNRIKRLCREAVRHNLVQIRSGFDIIISIKKQGSDRKLWDIEKELLYIFNKAKLLKTDHEQRGYARKVLPLS